MRNGDDASTPAPPEDQIEGSKKNPKGSAGGGKKTHSIKFSEKVTENDLAKKSFVQSFLSSIKQKMYGSR